MRLFGKIKASASKPAIPIRVETGSMVTAVTELARNTHSSKQDPLLVERAGSKEDAAVKQMEGQESEREERGPASTIDEMPFALNPIADQARTPVPRPLSNDPGDPELGAIVPFGQVPTSQGTPRDEINTSISETSSDDTAFLEMSVGSLPNPETLVMGQLIQWKFAAEEGPITLRVPAVLGALGVMLTTMAPLVLYMECFTPSHVIIAFFVFQLAVLICIIDGRSNYARDPLGFRAKLRNVVTRHFNVFRLVWGRGLLYIVAGLLNMAHEIRMCYIAGGVMCVIGVIAFFVGSRAIENLATLRKALSDDEFLWLEFLKHDRDRDGYLNPSEFAQFIWDLGLEFDDLYTLKAFTTIDTDHDQKIAFREFVRWWSQVRLKQGS